MHAALAEIASPRAPQSPAGISEPDWITRAADEHGYRWARIAWSRAASQEGAWFDQVKAQRVIDHWPQWFKLTLDRFFGQPFRLAFWQEVIVRLLVGWKVPVEVFDYADAPPRIMHVRLFRQLRLWVPRKNGKSEFLAALAILFFMREKVFGAEGFVFAKDEEQARIPFKRIKTMVALDPLLSKNTQTFNKSIYVPELGASIKLLAGKLEGKHGKAPTVILGDEMHEWTSTEISDVLREGTGNRLQPIELYASTAGLRTNRTGVELWDDSHAILDGRTEDPTTLAVIFAAEPEDDPFEESSWAKANPSLGVSPTFQFLRTEAAKARGNPRREARFRCYHLNQWIDAEVRWLPLTAWDACAPDKQAWKTRREKMRGRRCKAAFDVSSTQDITALIERFEEEDSDRVLFCARFWIPEESLSSREKAGRAPWCKWIEMGALEVTPGNAVDQDYVKKAIEEDLAMFEVEQIGCDPWNAAKLLGDLQKAGAGAERGDDDPLFVEIRQGILSLGEASKEFERRVFNGTLDHGGHPVLRWMAGHCVIRFDENLNFMPAKKRSRDKIDGIVAGVMTEALALTAPPPFRSAYEDHGLVEIVT